MLSNTLNYNEDNYNYNYIEGTELNEKELKTINILLKFDFKNASNNEINYIINSYTHNIFIIHESIKFNNLKFDIVEKNKKKYWKYEADDNLYKINCHSYIILKKHLFMRFKHLLILLNNYFDDDIKEYLHINFFNNINSCKYYICLRWFICSFIYWINIIKSEFIFNKINYKDFRKYILNFHKNKTNYDILKEVLKDFININYNFTFYEELKALLDYSLFFIYDYYYILQ